MTPAFGANLLLNGGFESGSFTGWTVSGNAQICQNGAPYCYPSEGNFVAVLNAGNLPPNAVISQSFATITGQEYQLSFNFFVNGSGQTIDVLVDDGQTQGDILNTNAHISSLTTLSYDFFAASDLTTLTFKDDPSNNSGDQDGYLDAISVTAVAPEPSGFVLFGGGLLAVYPFLRSRRRRE